MKEIVVGKGEPRRILHMLFDSIPKTVRFTAEPANQGGRLAGRVEVVGSRWLFRKPPAVHPLAAENAFAKTAWDSRYSITVIPEDDVRIRFESRHVSAKMLTIALGAVVAAAVLSVAVMATLRGGA